MEWSEGMKRAIDYIEDNLTGDVSIPKVARIACCSPFYFQRLFMIVTGMTVADYIRRRWLTLAAAELSSGNAKVIDVALKYGYDSPDSFGRAFRAMHSVNPLAAREPGTSLVAFPRISLQIELKGGTDVDYRIIEKPAFTIALMSRQFSNVNGQNFVEIPKWWEEFLASPDYGAMTALAGDKPGAMTGGEMLGICYGEADTGEFYYGIAVELPEGASVGKFDKMEVQATTWAVFGCTLANLQDVTKRIFRDWYLSTGYDHPGTPDLEVYLPGGSGPDMKCEIWAPVVPQKT